MKRGLIFLTILLCLSLLFAIPALADRSKTISGITWSYTTVGGVLEFSGEGELPPWTNTYRLFHWGNYDQDVRKIVINEGITRIAYLNGYEHLSEVSIANTVAVIGSQAFKDSTSLKEIEIPYGVTTIEPGAFSECTSLAEITLPDSLTSIGGDAFENTAFSSFLIPKGVTELYGSAFNDCSSLESFTVDPGNPSFTTVDGVLYSKDKKTLVRCPPARKGAFIIPDSVTTIGNGAFESCSNLTEISIPDSVTTIEGYAFEGCTSAKASIPTSITAIGAYAFSGCGGITSVTIPASTKIGDYAFVNSSLKTINVQCDLDSACVFSGCEQLVTVTLDQNVKTIGWHVFDECPIQDVFFGGAKSQVDKRTHVYIEDGVGGYTEPAPGTTITFYNGNDNLLNATWHYAIEDAPSEDQEQPPEDYTIDPFSQKLQHCDVETQNIYYNVSVNKQVIQENNLSFTLRSVTKDSDGNMKITVRKQMTGSSSIQYYKEGVELTIGDGEPQRIENKLRAQTTSFSGFAADWLSGADETFTIANPQDKDISLQFYFVWLDNNILIEDSSVTETERTTVKGGIEFILPIHFIGDGFEEYKEAEMKVLHVKNPETLPADNQISRIDEVLYDQDNLKATMLYYSCERSPIMFKLKVEGEGNNDLFFFATAITINGEKANFEPDVWRSLENGSTYVDFQITKWLLGTVPYDYQNPDAETDGVWPDKLESISLILNMQKISTSETVVRIPFIIYFDKTSEPDVETILPGDVDGNGEVDGRDVVRLMNWLAGEIDPETDEEYEIYDDNADVNGDGVVNEKDLLRLVRYFGGEKVTLEFGKVTAK